MFFMISIVISFLFGSIPTGYLVCKRFTGIDIRTKGSGNIGSTNVKRIVGKKAAYITQTLDILKGIIPILFCIYLEDKVKLPISKNVYLSANAIATILGHDYTPFLGFKGGKGVNTTLGAFVLIAPFEVFFSVGIYFFLRLFTSIVSIRSILLGISLPIACIIFGLPYTTILATLVAALLVILRHKDNIKRLVLKEENK